MEHAWGSLCRMKSTSLFPTNMWLNITAPPRIAALAQEKGLVSQLSLDIETGWDLRLHELRKLSLQLLVTLPILFLILCPPCTIFSELQRLWNMKRMSKATWDSKWEEGMLHVSHCMDCAAQQVRRGRWFFFEHPSRASSWMQPCVERVQRLPGVMTIVIDQCMVGLRSKVDGVPMRKRTKIMTNSRHLVHLLAGRRCDRQHEHRVIEGSEGGCSRAKWAQRYPRQFCEIVVLAARWHAGEPNGLGK